MVVFLEGGGGYWIGLRSHEDLNKMRRKDGGERLKLSTTSLQGCQVLHDVNRSHSGS